MFTALCEDCGKTREVKNKPKAHNKCCRECSDKRRKGTVRKRYDRVCDTCGDIKTTKYKPIATTCAKCKQKEMGKRLSEMNIKTDKDKAKSLYWYFCRTCSDVKAKNKRRKGCSCGECFKFRANRPEPTMYYDLIGNDVRHYRICDKCDDVKEVAKANSGYETCDKCLMENNKIAQGKSNRATGRKKNISERKVYVRKKTVVSQEAIDKQRAINKAHREAQSVKKVEPNQLHSDAELIALWLSKHSVKECSLKDVEPANQVISISSGNSGSYL